MVNETPGRGRKSAIHHDLLGIDAHFCYLVDSNSSYKKKKESDTKRHSFTLNTFGGESREL